MINTDREQESIKIATSIALILNLKYRNTGKTLEEWQNIILDELSTIFPKSKITNEEKAFIVNWILESRPIVFSRVDGILFDDNRKWFSEEKARDNSFFDRYSRYLIQFKHFHSNAIEKLSKDILNPIMDQLGNPRAQENFERHGLVVGDVQSGKTLTYIGLINKAADAGYKVIIVLTGTIETLRKQTQERIDEGFTGVDSSSTEKTQTFIGVGLDPASKKGRYAASFTTKDCDFTVAQANGVGVSMSNLSSPVIIVAKKNVNVLLRIYNWLIGNNISIDNKIDYPLLLIDDEADNASINTKDENTDPTRTNERIRKLLNLFSRFTYIGFTATPFANIFINPDLYDKELGQDLFPRDFIFNLTPNEDYIGGKDIFLDDAKYKKSLILNDDCEIFLPASHKKSFEFKVLPNTLKESIIAFTITNVIRDLRGDVKTHRSMLINISRFISMHDVIYNEVFDYYKKILNSYFSYCKSTESDSILSNAESFFNREYINCGHSWMEVKALLYESNKQVLVKSINSDNDMINYKEYKGTGARCIFIGGLSLSRGLTLEGLCISYFYRFSKTYDVLFQMGRWFGYRPKYDDLFRIYMPKNLQGWYSSITESIEALRIDLIRMQQAGRKPEDFGIRVMNDTTKLKITNPSKMRTAQTEQETVLGFGEIIPTPDIYYNTEINKSNYISIIDTLSDAIANDDLTIEIDPISNNKCIKNVSIDYIYKIITGTSFSPANSLYEPNSLIEFLKKFENQYFKNWDIVFPEGKKIDDNLWTINQLKFEGNPLQIHLTKKRFDVYHNYLRMQGAREQLHNAYDTASCLRDQELFNQIFINFKKVYKLLHPNKEPNTSSIPAKEYLNTKDRNPLLMIFLIELSDTNITEEGRRIKNSFIKEQIIPVGIAFGIPKYTTEITKLTTYHINMVEQRNRRQREYQIEDEIYEEEE